VDTDATTVLAKIDQTGSAFYKGTLSVGGATIAAPYTGGAALAVTTGIRATNTVSARASIVSNAVTAGFNVASVSHTGTGSYTIAFSNALASANYQVSVLLIGDVGAAGISPGQTTSGFGLSVVNVSGTPTDENFQFVVSGGN